MRTPVTPHFRNGAEPDDDQALQHQHQQQQ